MPRNALIEWTAELEFGVPQIDAEHRQLIALVNRFAEYVNAGTAEVYGPATLKELLRLAHAHFDSEEALMRAHDYPGYLNHHEQHSELLSQLELLTSRLASEAHSVDLDKATGFLRDWFLMHFQRSDRPFLATLGGESR